jgi:hypothetical protein
LDQSLATLGTLRKLLTVLFFYFNIVVLFIYIVAVCVMLKNNKFIFLYSYILYIFKGAIRTGAADLIAFGRLYISNPDLVERFKNNWPLNPDAPHTVFYYNEGFFFFILIFFLFILFF